MYTCWCSGYWSHCCCPAAEYINNGLLKWTWDICKLFSEHPKNNPSGTSLGDPCYLLGIGVRSVTSGDSVQINLCCSLKSNIQISIFTSVLCSFTTAALCLPLSDRALTRDLSIVCTLLTCPISPHWGWGKNPTLLCQTVLRYRDKS